MGFAAELTSDALALRCVEESASFSRQRGGDSRYCYELLRRALADGATDALAHVFRIYERQASSWAYQHSGLAETGESAEYFARAALSSLYFALRGERFANFPELAHVLAYLKACVHTSIAQHLREQRRRRSVPLDEGRDMDARVNLAARLDAEELWGYICGLLGDPADQLLARCAFLLDMKPRHIAVTYPQHWHSERAVSLSLYRIRRRLRTDAELRRRLGLADGEPPLLHRA